MMYRKTSRKRTANRAARSAEGRLDNPFRPSAPGVEVRRFTYTEGREGPRKVNVGIHAHFGLANAEYKVVTVVVAPQDVVAWKSFFESYKVRVISTATAWKNRSWDGLILCVDPKTSEGQAEIDLFIQSLGTQEVQIVECKNDSRTKRNEGVLN